MDKKRKKGSSSKKQNGGTNRGQGKKPDNFQWKSRSLIIWILVILGSVLFANAFGNLGGRGEQAIEYGHYRDFLEAGDIEKAIIEGDELHGELKYENTIEIDRKAIKVLRFHVTLPFIEDWMLKEWDDYGVDYNFQRKSVDWLGYFLNLLPWILIMAVFWIFFLRRMQGGGAGGIFSFGKSRAKLITESKPRVTFDDVAGADEAKEELLEIIDFLKVPDKYQRLGGRIPRGALLLGPPGTGKTLLAKAVAGEASVPFFSISGADFVEMFVGVGASRVRDLFEQGKRNAPCIIFIDEIDAVGRHRGAGLGGGHDEREQTLNQLLVEMDGFETDETVILLAATNRPDVLDTALLRPGRFDRQIVVDRPDIRGREGILKVHTKKVPLADDVKLDILAKGTPGFSGADLANLVNEAALLSARNGKKHVEMEDMESAKDKELMGVERKSMVITEDEKRSTAFHEAGHVLVAKLIPESDPVHKVTIIPRGRALGVTSYLPIDERHSYSKTTLEIRLVHLLGGRVAEKLVYNHFTTGAGDDIERATELARKMVCEWGMSDKIGPLAFGKENEEIFIGREIARSKNYSEQTALLIDSETSKIVKDASNRAERLIKGNMKKLHAIAEALLIYETLDGDEVDQIFKGKTLKIKSRKAENSAKSSDNSGDGKSQKKQASGTTRRKKKVEEESKTE
ncbi:ATP-dependent zinc metalloprotease FtsH [candidate division KSB1 bacterium]|nr:ATP-dependent zinc metalloprotease FtsH [candidate division KSB1 bacterium]